jgi:hypothetical protein
METLTQLLNRYGRRGGSRHWIGPRPAVRDGQLIASILQKVGYPESKEFVAGSSLISLSRKQAARTLSFVATRSLVWHVGGEPPEANVKDVLEALKDLEDTAAFFSNGAWAPPGLPSWSPVSNATFDGGVLGYDATHAFIFWVEEED